MNYTQLTEKNKVEIDILIKENYSMRQIGKILGKSHSTISRHLSGKYKKRNIDIKKKYPIFTKYIIDHYDRRNNSIDVISYKFREKYKYAPKVSVRQVYNWIYNDKLELKRNDLCYKQRKRGQKNKTSMMSHTKWNMENKTVLPIRLRPKSVEKRNIPGHLEIDSIIGKKNEHQALITIVDRCTRMLWTIKADYRYDHYTSNLIYKYIIENNIIVKSITVDNGKEFSTMGIAAKRLGIKLYKCDPYCSFQRGSNERMNAIVRRYLPKGSSFKYTKQYTLDDICFKINAMPRKIFNFKSAYEMQMICKLNN